MLTKSKSAKQKNPEILDENQAEQKFTSKFSIASLKNRPWWRLETALIAGAVVAALLSGFMSHQNSLALENSMSRRYKTESIIVANGEPVYVPGRLLTRA